MLITDSLPADRNLPDTLARITVAAKGRPVHTILVQTPPDPNEETRKLTNQDAECESFLRKLTQATGSVLRKVKIDVSGNFFDDVTLVRESRYDQKRTESGRNFVENGVGDNLDGTTFLMTERYKNCFKLHDHSNQLRFLSLLCKLAISSIYYFDHTDSCKQK